MDAFKNYSSMLDDINTADERKNAMLKEATERKEKAMEITKVLGEGKLYLSGKSIGDKVGQAIKDRVKPELEKAGDFIKGRINEVGERAKTAINQALTGDELEGTGPTRMENLQDEIARRSGARAKARQRADEEQGQRDRGVGPNESGDTEAGTELETVGRGGVGGGENPVVENPSFDANASGDFDLLQSSSNMAQSGGITESTLGSTLNASRGGNFQNPIANARANKFAPDQEDPQAFSTPRSTIGNPDVIANKINPDIIAEKAGGQTEDLASNILQKGKSVLKAGGDAVEGVGETASGILDAIPGLDVVGVISGAVLAGVASHRANIAGKMEKAKMLDPSLMLGSTYQAGVGTD